MGKVLRSGMVYMGTCGEPSGLTDSFGCELSVGDLVDVYSETEEKRGFGRDAAGPEYVVMLDREETFGSWMSLGSASTKARRRWV